MLDQFTPMHPSLRREGRNLRWKWGVFKWLLFIWCFRIFSFLPGRGKLICGKRISLQGKIRIKGPGTVIIQDDVIIGDHTDLYTHMTEAVITIGKNTFLNGTRISSSKEISIGPNNILADTRIMDTDFHWLHAERMTDHRHPPTAPVKTENNVWIAAGSAVIKGVTIGENSVIAFGSVVTNKVPPNEIWGGVPAKKISDVPQKGMDHV